MRYTRPRAQAEAKINKWMARMEMLKDQRRKQHVATINAAAMQGKSPGKQAFKQAVGALKATAKRR